MRFSICIQIQKLKLESYLKNIQNGISSRDPCQLLITSTYVVQSTNVLTQLIRFFKELFTMGKKSLNRSKWLPINLGSVQQQVTDFAWTQSKHKREIAEIPKATLEKVIKYAKKRANSASGKEVKT